VVVVVVESKVRARGACEPITFWLAANTTFESSQHRHAHVSAAPTRIAISNPTAGPLIADAGGPPGTLRGAIHACLRVGPSPSGHVLAFARQHHQPALNGTRHARRRRALDPPPRPQQPRRRHRRCARWRHHEQARRRRQGAHQGRGSRRR
jgi:hypothetical protein